MVTVPVDAITWTRGTCGSGNTAAATTYYDGAGTNGWLACLATSTNLTNWTAKGPVLTLGQPGSEDSASASYGVTFFDGKTWHMFYLGTPHTTPAPDFIPAFPYLMLIFYDGNASEKLPPGVKSHMNRDVGLAWLELPLTAMEVN